MPQRLARHFGLAGIELALHHGAELHLHAPRHHHAMLPLQQKRHPAFARLAVDADDAVVGAAQVCRVDGQVGHRPHGIRIARCRAGGKPLLDGILMRARERGEHQVAHIRVAGVDGQGGAGLHHPRHGVDVGKVQPGVDALGVEVERHGHDVQVAAALAVAEQAALHPLRTGQHGQLGSGHAGAPVVVRMDRQHHVLARAQVPVHPLDLVGKHVGRGVFDGGGQVDDHLAPRPRAPGGQCGLAGLQGHVQLGHAEGFGRVLKHPLRLGAGIGQAFEPTHAGRNQPHHLRHVHAKHHVAPHRRGGVVQVDDGAGRTAQGLDGALDQLGARLRHHHDGHIGGNEVLLDQAAHKVEVGLRCGGKPHLDLLEAHAHQLPEQLHLALAAHGLEQGLVAIAQVGGQPHGRTGEGVGRPGAIGQGHGHPRRGKRTVFAGRVGKHGENSTNWAGGHAPPAGIDESGKNQCDRPCRASQPTRAEKSGSWAGVRGKSGACVAARQSDGKRRLTPAKH